MDRNTAGALVSETGRILIEKKLVARTWGNFSARLDEEHFLITPSGLGYEHMTAEDLVSCSLEGEAVEGTRKPSSEKGIHAAAYRLFPEAGFVIHTHQTYATALGLSGSETMNLTPEEKERLGGLSVAGYGLPGTGKLRDAVTECLKKGNHTVLMAHHGALIIGKDREEAIRRAELLEEVCRRNCLGQKEAPSDSEAVPAPVPEAFFQKTFPNAGIIGSAPVRTFAALGIPLSASLDDMAQMMGRAIPAAKEEKEVLSLLKKHPSVFLPGTGAIVCGIDAEDTEALRVLTEKAAVAALHCRALGEEARLGLFDCLLMRAVYSLKYSKQKKG